MESFADAARKVLRMRGITDEVFPLYRDRYTTEMIAYLRLMVLKEEDRRHPLNGKGNSHQYSYLSLSLYIYIYIYIRVYVYVCIYIYIYIHMHTHHFFLKHILLA